MNFGADCVMIVLAYEEQREPPQAGHVERFMKRTLIHGAIAKEADHRFGAFAHRHSISDADCDRVALANDGISTHEAPLGIEHVHGAAHAAAHAIGASEELRHDVARRRSTNESMRVFAIGADDIIGRPRRIDDACADCLLARDRGAESRRYFPSRILRQPALRMLVTTACHEASWCNVSRSIMNRSLLEINGRRRPPL